MRISDWSSDVCSSDLDVKFKYGNLKAPAPLSEGIILYYLQEVLSPRRIAGQLLLVHETTDQTVGGRNAWLYSPGLGRTRRAPNVGYDNPKTSADDLMFNDQRSVKHTSELQSLMSSSYAVFCLQKKITQPQ